MQPIHCDRCGCLFTPDNAVMLEVDEEVFWFCSEDCKARARRLDPLQYAGPEERGSGPLTAPELEEEET